MDNKRGVLPWLMREAGRQQVGKERSLFLDSLPACAPLLTPNFGSQF